MIEIRFHGRGGQGAVTASKLLADACFKEGMDVQSFPFFGVERRGAPVTAFTKIDSKPIRIKSSVYTPDYVIVLDPSLLGAVDVEVGLKEGGKVLVNMGKDPRSKLRSQNHVSSVDATQIAIDNRLGSRNAPVVNSSILGAFCKISGLFSIDTLEKSIREMAPAKKEENVKAARKAYESVTEW